MAPQTSIPAAANVLGTIGTVLWCVQLCPQIWHSYRTKTVEGLPAAMVLLWSLSGLPFGVYSISQRFNIPLQIQPQFFCLLCMCSWGQCMYYGRKWRAWVCVLACSAMLITVGVLQVVLVLVIRGPYSRGVSWPVTTMGIIACVVLVSGYIPIPFELIKRRGRVVGVDFWFLLLDSSGAFFSLMSLVAQNTFDIEFGTLYALCCAIEYGMFISHGIWLLRTRGIRKRAKEAQLSFDDFPEGTEWQDKGFKVNLAFLKMIPPRMRRKCVNLDRESCPAVVEEQELEPSNTIA